MNNNSIKKEFVPIMRRKGIDQKDLAAMFLDDTELLCAIVSSNVSLWVLYPTDIMYDCGKVTNIAYNPSIGWYADIEISSDYANLILYFKQPVIYFWGQITDDVSKVDRFIICDSSELDSELYCKGI